MDLFDKPTLDRITIALTSFLRLQPIKPLPRHARIRSIYLQNNSNGQSCPVLNTGQSASFTRLLRIRYTIEAEQNDGSLSNSAQAIHESNLPVFIKTTPRSSDETNNDKRLRIIQSTMNELTFYLHVLPDLILKQAISTPALFSAYANTAAHRVHMSSISQHSDDDLNSSEITLILESYAGDSHYQCSPVHGKAVINVVHALANLHSKTMGDASLLELARQKLSAPAYWRLRKRPASELEKLPVRWKEFISSFKGSNSRLDALFAREQAAHMGERLQNMANILDKELDCAVANEKWSCVIHGDPKSMNMFMPVSETASDNVIFIDFQWTGVGIGAIDLAMFLPHSVDPKDMDDHSKIDRLLRVYHSALMENVQDGEYSFCSFKRHFTIASLDYARFVIARFFKGATPAGFEKKKNEPNVGLIYRNVDACVAFLERVYDYIDEFQKSTW